MPDGDAVVPRINRLAASFANVVQTQDWHPPGHISFASSHPGRQPFDTIGLPYGNQILWPDHCVQATHSAELVKDLSIPHAALILRKGYHATVDSYSAFNEADGTPTGLAAYLHARGTTQPSAGLATDFCVAFSAIDARRAGFQALAIEDACRGIDTNGSLAAAWTRITDAGVRRIQSSDIATD